MYASPCCRLALRLLVPSCPRGLATSAPGFGHIYALVWQCPHLGFDHVRTSVLTMSRTSDFRVRTSVCLPILPMSAPRSVHHRTSALKRPLLPSPLHQNTLAAAALGIVISHLHLAHLVASVGHPAAGGVTLHLTVVLADFADRVVKCLFDIYRRLGRRLEELAAKGIGERLALCSDSSAFGGQRVGIGCAMQTYRYMALSARAPGRTCSRQPPWGSCPCP